MKSGRTKILDEINITPLTDIFLVLLIIMMVVTPLYSDKQLSVNVRSSQQTDAAEPETSEESKTVNVAIDASGAFTIDGVSVSPDRLAAVLTQTVQTKPDGMILRTHAEAPFASMAQAMDAAEIAQVKGITIVDASGEAEPEATTPP